MESITLEELQKQVDNWANQFEKPYFSPLSRMAALTEETGELARIMNRMYGDKPRKTDEEIKNLEEETGDLLFSLICNANAEGINLEKCMQKKMEKVNNRDNNRFAKKEDKQC